eukprot:PhF_6_TR35217/c0_g1_i1/m.51276/K08731/BIRC5; baculoviral IAP repeat-containing protein 5
MSRPKHGMMANEVSRLYSFTSWPVKSDKCTPQALAEAGFFHNPDVRSPDRTVCFMCGLELSRWEVHDVPLDEHLRHGPSCEHLQQLIRNGAGGSTGSGVPKNLGMGSSLMSSSAVSELVRLAKERTAPNIAFADQKSALFVATVLSTSGK